MLNRQVGWRAAAGGLICLLMVVTAMLLWGRLKLVTGVPRTVLAEPEAAQVEGGPADHPRKETPSSGD